MEQIKPNQEARTFFSAVFVLVPILSALPLLPLFGLLGVAGTMNWTGYVHCKEKEQIMVHWFAF